MTFGSRSMFGKEYVIKVSTCKLQYILIVPIFKASSFEPLTLVGSGAEKEVKKQTENGWKNGKYNNFVQANNKM